ncbi:MAG TPA: SIS domain-containing protein [Ktedonobacteraceae bacterium]|nr:SIS domain-containing protein [Ktedonobacteraceae bacterium]
MHERDTTMIETNGAGSATRQEILTQTLAWQDALATVKARQDALRRLWRERPCSEVLVTGCGSTFYLSQAVAPLIQQQLGIRARAVPASELLFFPQTVITPDSQPLLLALSRSGRTSETIRAVRAYKAHHRGPVIHIGCYPATELVMESDLALVIKEGQEESVVQTRSFSSMLVAAQAVVTALVDENQLPALAELPAVGQQLLADAHALIRTLGHDDSLERFYFLGSGLQYGLASEANLKMKEMSLAYSEAFHFMEFRHGPMSMVNQRTLIVGLLSEAASQQEIQVLREMRQQGARTLVLSTRTVPADAADYQIAFQTKLPETQRAVLFLPVLQLLGYYRALKNGQNPDQPHNLTAVIVLEPEK